MPQETNLNVSPYFDDFNVDNNYYKVLFKPEYPVQARELTGLQSILQNQIEQFGNHIFKEGSVVTAGQPTVDIPFHAVEIEPEFNNIPISAYFSEILGKRLRGAISGVSAKVVYTLDQTLSERGTYTLYVQYLESGGENLENKVFFDGEPLVTENPITYANFTIQAGQEICNTIAENATSDGSSFKIAEGIYYIRGFFARAQEQRILLDQYGVSPSYKIGFNVIERIVDSFQDETLFDNSQGFSNYAAPGADRFQIELELTKYGLDEEPDNFVEIAQITNGSLRVFNKNPQYSLIRDELARRTAETNGDYYVKPFTLFVRDCLNDRTLNDGIYFEEQTTVNGNTPSEDVMIYEVGPGKAYVNGYDVETISPTLLEVPKTRDTKTKEKQVIPYNAGQLVGLNNVTGAPYIGFGTSGFVSLIDSRIGINSSVAAGTTIGVARVYDYIPESNYTDKTSVLNLRLFDVQTFTKITLTTEITQATPTHIKGKRSNSTGFLYTSVSNSKELILYQVSGKFLENEQIVINGIDNGRLINSIVDYSVSDVKSIFSTVGVSTFNADLILDTKNYIAPTGTQFNITARSSTGISTVSAGLDINFLNAVKPGDIVGYSLPSVNNIIYNKVETVSTGGTNFTISGITTVTGICDGSVPAINVTVTNIVKLTGSIYSKDSSLLTKINNSNISSISLDSSEIKQRRVFNNQTISGNSISLTLTDEDVFFDSFDEDRYFISYSNGTIEPLRRDKFSFDGTSGKQIIFRGLSQPNGTVATVITTVKNIKPNSKNKILNKANTITISGSKYAASGIGTTTLNDGLAFNSVYGTRVQDEEISLNVPDAIGVLAVYESEDSSDPKLPTLQLTSFSGPTNSSQDFFIGEELIGKSSGAVALIVSRINSNEIEYVYLNSFSFSEDEVVESRDSKVQAVILIKTLGDKNVTQNFIFDDGQRESILDYSRIIRKQGVKEPKNKIKVVFQNYTINSNDTGEFVTVNSYKTEDFKHNIPYFNKERISDFIDIRPRVAPYVSGQTSPFEFATRNFSADGQYSNYVLAPEENLVLTYSYYVPRIDVIFLNPDGTFEVVQGNPDDVPRLPEFKSNAFDIAVVNIPPYVYDVKNIIVNMSEHKRYTMDDISLLEDRISRVEEFTVLTALESKTENFTIKDAETGLDRFKCGFFVDDFTSHAYHDLQNSGFRSAIDKERGMMRPLHYTTSLDLQLGSNAVANFTNNFNVNADQNFVEDLGSPGIKKTGDLVTLNYNEVEYNKQSLATKSVSVTEFLVRYWTGLLTLNPPIDTWVDPKAVTTNSFNEVRNVKNRLPDKNITIVNDETENNVVNRRKPNSQSGFDPFDWLDNTRRRIAKGGQQGSVGNKSRKALVIGKNAKDQVRTLEIINGNTIRIDGLHWKETDLELLSKYVPTDVAEQFITRMNADGRSKGGFLEFTPTKLENNKNLTTTTRTETNVKTFVTPEKIIQKDSKSRSISNYTEPVRFLRSRNIEFDARGLKPRTIFYPFFQGVKIDSYVTPKLLEIEMISGRFEVGEIVSTDPTFVDNKISFRLCAPNHKSGPARNPKEVFELNPYTQNPFDVNYTRNSSILNVDTTGLQLQSESRFYGQVVRNMILVGKNSKAKARVRRVRLISDNSGTLIGSFYIPDPNVRGNPKWINGENTFTLIDTESLDQLKLVEFIPNSRINESSAEAIFSSSGSLDIKETNILTTRNITVKPSRNVTRTTINNVTTNTTSLTQEITAGTVRIQEPYDPIAQSFYVQEDTGIFLTSVDVFFETRDSDNLPVTLQIRPVIGGIPSNVVVPFSEVTITPDKVNVSRNGRVATKFTFPSPVYLQGPTQQTVRHAPIASETLAEYAIVILSNSPNYRVFVTELGQDDILSGVKVSNQNQTTLGSLFKSQNGTVWTPSQLEDLKYTIHRANFVDQGLVRFFNPELDFGNEQITVTGPNQFEFLSKRVSVGLGSTGYSSDIVPGVTIKQGASSGTLIGVGGSIAGAGTTISNVGVAYTNGTYSGVELVTETGFGLGAIATIVIFNNIIDSVNITNGGNGYSVGDSLIVPPLGQGVGFGGKLTVTQINSPNTFILDEVQGSFTVGITTLTYTNSSGTDVSAGNGIVAASVNEDQYNDGLHIKVYQQNHGMHSFENLVRISEFRPSNIESNTRLSAALDSSENSTISVISTNGFQTFEGLTVSPLNPGYLIIGDEVVEYTGISGNTFTGITRAIDSTDNISYRNNTRVYKYEYNGVSLRRINKVHNFAEVDVNNTGKFKIDLDSYFIKIDTSNDDFLNNTIGVNRSNNLYFRKNIQGGSSGVVISNNIQYESISPDIANLIPAKTDIKTRIRTFTGTSVGGNEKSFVDRGFENISLDEQTYFNEPKLICSTVNAQRFITEAPGNRSLTLEMLMTTRDSRVSPVVDMINAAVTVSSNLINNPNGIGEDSNYAIDTSVRSNDNDEHSAIYISKPVGLKIPANSIKVILSASRNDLNDVRVLYQIFREDEQNVTPPFNLFPGYANYRVDGVGIKRVIDVSLSDGSADSRVQETSDRSFKDYEYSVDDLPDFTAFAIKIVMASSNQATPPLIRDLRAIATTKPKL
jgi:hypothetical protein